MRKRQKSKRHQVREKKKRYRKKKVRDRLTVTSTKMSKYRNKNLAFSPGFKSGLGLDVLNSFFQQRIWIQTCPFLRQDFDLDLIPIFIKKLDLFTPFKSDFAQPCNLFSTTEEVEVTNLVFSLTSVRHSSSVSELSSV